MKNTRLLIAMGTLALFASLWISLDPQAEVDLQAAAQAPSRATSGAGYQVINLVGGGSISGTIVVTGNVPRLQARTINKDPQVCGTGTRPSQALLVSGSAGLKNAVVYLEDVRRGKPLAASHLPAQIDQKSCEYAPHVQVVLVNTEVAVVNSDPTLHNIHTYFNKGETFFNIAQPIKNQVYKKVFPSKGMIYAECDVHGWMQAYVLVVDNPYFAITDDAGRFIIRDIPPGTYTAKVWHEYLGEKTQNITVAGGSDTALNLDLRDLLAAKAPASPISSSRPGGQSLSNVVTVEMRSEGTTFHFEPAMITIKAGTTVTWVNVSSNRHSSTADSRYEKKKGQAIVPPGAEPWTSNFLANGDSFMRTFTIPGTYGYFCRNHEQFGMVGKIIVEP